MSRAFAHVPAHNGGVSGRISMRKISLLLALGACIALTGCDWWHSKPAQPVTVNCNCRPPIRGALTAPPPVQHTARRTVYRRSYRRHRAAHYAYAYHRHYAHGSRRYLWHKRNAEASMDIYGYSSSSHVSSSHGYGRAYGHGYGESCCGEGGLRAHYGATTRVWADGYGRRHIYDESAVKHYVYQAHQRRAQESERLDPWHGYNDDWE